MHVVMALVVVERLRCGNRLVDGHWRSRLRCTARGGRRCFNRVGSGRGRRRLRIITMMVVTAFYARPVIMASCVPGGRCRVGFRVIVVVGLSCIAAVVMGPRFRTCWRVVAMAQTRRSTHGGSQRNDPDRAEEHHGAAESWQRFSLQTAVPNPARAHHDINLEQQRA